MPVNHVLAAIAAMEDVADEAVLNQIWKLAEGSGDLDVMRTLALRPGSLPSSVSAGLRLRKEVDVRIAYLSRPDLEDDERGSLLENEKRSEVFAGLIDAAAKNPLLASRLEKQFAFKPTKVLARQLLRSDFGNADLRFECLRRLIDDKRPPDWLWRKFREIVTENLGNKERSEELVSILPPGLLVSLDMAILGEEAQLRLIERLVDFASRDHRHAEWEVRRVMQQISSFLVASSALANLSDAVVNALDAVSTAAWMSDGDRIAGALAGRRAMMSDTIDDLRLRARELTGSKLDDLFELVLADRTDGSETLVQGLLENPAAWKHVQFSNLLVHVPAAFVVKAMQATRSHDLMSRLWEQNSHMLPDACWEYVDEEEMLAERLIEETLARENVAFRIQNSIPSLIDRGVSDAAIGRLPFSLFTDSYGYRRYSSSVLNSSVQQVVRLQMATLGENAMYWENFNNLSAGWSGSLMELLEAARNL